MNWALYMYSYVLLISISEIIIYFTQWIWMKKEEKLSNFDQFGIFEK